MVARLKSEPKTGSQKVFGSTDYPTSDGKPMAETDTHRILMNALIQMLDHHFAASPKVYVSGNLLMFYEKGNRRKHVSPDVFVVKGVPKGERLNYLIWEEGKAPNVVIEMTSSSTRSEDVKTKYALYRDVLKVKEYFLFDPRGDYLNPPLQGILLLKGDYQAIPLVDVRMHSSVLDLELEPAKKRLKLFNPATNEYLKTPEERADEAQQENERLREQLQQLMRERKNGK